MGLEIKSETSDMKIDYGELTMRCCENARESVGH